MFLSDAALYLIPYITIKITSFSQDFYLKIVHVSNVAHELHRVGEKIREQFPKIAQLISNIKKVFLKAPSCVVLSKNEALDISLLLLPKLTRWSI